MHKRSYYIINGITWFRIIAFPVLILLIFTDRIDIFKWLLGVSFFTDAIDGYLARKYKVTSIFGSRLDSIGDDLTIVAGVLGMFYFKWGFVKSEYSIISIMLLFYVAQLLLALVRYKKISSFHTYLAKCAAVLQALFLISSFFVAEPFTGLFYLAAIITIIELLEEIILVLMLPQWEANVKGLYWVLKEKKR